MKSQRELRLSIKTVHGKYLLSCEAVMNMDSVLLSILNSQCSFARTYDRVSYFLYEITFNQGFCI